MVFVQITEISLSSHKLFYNPGSKTKQTVKIKVPFVLNHVCCDLLRCCRLSAKMLCCCRSNPGHGFVLLPWATRGLPLSFHSSPKKLSRVTLNPWYNSCCIKVSREKCLVVTKTVNVRRLTLRISNGPS